MYITNAYIDGFRNLKEISIKPHNNINIIVGNNAQGKTNFIEALWVLSGCKSFRGAHERDFINFNGKNAIIQAEFENSVRKQKICFTYYKAKELKKKIKLNDIELKSTINLYENYQCIAFTPNSLDIVKGSPCVRRNFIDMCISQIKPKYIRYINKANNILLQRNAVIRNIIEGKARIDDLESWNYSLAQISTYISVMRALYIKTLDEYVNEILNYITDSNEKIKVSYISSVYNPDEEKILDEYLSILNKSYKIDLKYGYSTIGIHHDDISIILDGKKSRDFASQGQARSIVIALKLAQARILSRQNESPPIMFFDDIFSELDLIRQGKIMNFSQNMQIFLTCCDKNVCKIENAKLFEMDTGKITEVN